MFKKINIKQRWEWRVNINLTSQSFSLACKIYANVLKAEKKRVFYWNKILLWASSHHVLARFGEKQHQHFVDVEVWKYLSWQCWQRCLYGAGLFLLGRNKERHSKTYILISSICYLKTDVFKSNWQEHRNNHKLFVNKFLWTSKWN